MPCLRARHYDALVTMAFASLVRLVDSRTEKDTRFYQDVDTPFGNLPFELGNLFLAEAGRGIDTHMAILVLIALCGGLNLGFGTQNLWPRG